MIDLLQWEAEICGWLPAGDGDWYHQPAKFKPIVRRDSPPTHADLRPELLRLAAEAGKGAGLEIRSFNGGKGLVKSRHRGDNFPDNFDPLTSTDDALTLARAVDPGMISIRNRIMSRIVGGDVDMTPLEIFTVYLSMPPKDQARTLTAAAIEAAGVVNQ